MMFNGLFMCNDSDTSDFAKESGGEYSGADSVASDPASRNADYYRNKLQATLQILQNKEETFRIQSESLSVAEERIASLTAQNRDLQTQLEITKVQKVEAFVSAQEREEHKEVVNTLTSNLTTIQDIYRECFYETAKQEHLIEMLRKSCLDVRLMAKQKTDHIGRLENLIDCQKLTIRQSQDIAMEVDNLKSEITNFLSNSNNDSGMWERSEDSTSIEVADDVQDIMEQLMLLREMLQSDCICGLKLENTELRKSIEQLQIEKDELQKEIKLLKSALSTKDQDHLKCQTELQIKESELSHVHEQLLLSECRCREEVSRIEDLRNRLNNNQAMLNEKQLELSEKETEINNLNDEVEKANRILKESAARSEVSRLSSQVTLWRAQLADSAERAARLDEQLQRTTTHCRELESCYREKSRQVDSLEQDLLQTQAASSALCEETERIVTNVRHWLQNIRDKQRRQLETIEDQEQEIKMLRCRVGEGRVELQRASASEAACWRRRDVTRCACGCVRGASDTHSAASAADGNVPAKGGFSKKRCKCTAVRSVDETRDGMERLGCCQHTAPVRISRIPREMSPPDDLLDHLRSFSDVLNARKMRWKKRRDDRT